MFANVVKGELENSIAPSDGSLPLMLLPRNMLPVESRKYMPEVEMDDILELEIVLLKHWMSKAIALYVPELEEMYERAMLMPELYVKYTPGPSAELRISLFR